MSEEELAPENGRESMASLPCLTWLSIAQQKRLDVATTSYEVAPGELVFDEDPTTASNIFVLLSGAARLVCLGTKRQQITIAIFPPGVLPRPAIPGYLNCRLRCEAVRQSRVAKVSRANFIEIVLGVQVTCFDSVSALIFGGMENMLTRYPGFFGLDLRSRLAVALLELGLLFGVRDARGILLSVTLTQQELADLVGASRPKISIILSEFVRSHAIYREGRRIALVPSRLEEVAHLRRSLP
jgi:CRP-like cAMP-binding protein